MLLPGLIDCHAHLLASMNPRLQVTEALTVAVTQMSPAQRALLGARNARDGSDEGADGGGNTKRPPRGDGRFDARQVRPGYTARVLPRARFRDAR